MNKKRQTVWLVSMLSIMVILSAYYLFTDDLSQADLASQQGDMDQQIVLDMLGNDENEHSLGTLDPLTIMGIDNEKTDADILAEFESGAENVQEVFAAMEIERDEELGKKGEELGAIISDATRPDEEVKQALADMQELQAVQEKIDRVEEKLMFSFGYQNAVIQQENDEWQVNILADTFTNSEFVSIVDLMKDEFGVGADDITVIRHSSF